VPLVVVPQITMSATPEFLTIPQASRIAGVPYMTGRRRAFAGQWGPLNTKGKRKLVTVAGLSAALGRPLTTEVLAGVAMGERRYTRAEVDRTVVAEIVKALRCVRCMGSGDDLVLIGYHSDRYYRPLTDALQRKGT
jgi:hypothetical protein